MQPKSVPVETVDIGDDAQFFWTDGDIKRTARGRVARIMFYGRTRTFLSESGQEIARYSLDSLKSVTVFMYEKYSPLQPELFKV